jgi:hypothetical protein
MKASINELLSTRQHLTERKNELQRLMHAALRRTVRKSTYEGNTEVTIDESRYDPDDLEKKISDINYACLQIDTSVKNANATTMVDIDIDAKTLLTPVAPRPWQPNKEENI